MTIRASQLSAKEMNKRKIRRHISNPKLESQQVNQKMSSCMRREDQL